jgi:HD-GYP domain-containing protein (c-di-GMP phosphodiesterase class II)
MKNHIDYKKELESASKGMIMIHDPKLLIKLIVRMIVSKVQVKHAAMILYDPARDSYVLNISRGETGVKIPVGFTRFDRDNPIIKVFNNKDYKMLAARKSAIVSQDINKLIWQEAMFNSNDASMRELLHQFGEQLTMFNAVACVPAYYRDMLLAVLLLGEKHDGGPFDQDELDFFAALASDAAMAIRNAQLFDDLKREAEKNHDLFVRTTIVLSSAIEAKDKYTRGHTGRVTNFAIAIARQMEANGTAVFPEDFFENLYMASVLHDIGKIGVPENILNKIERLTDEDIEILRKHTLFGYEILRPLSELKDSLDGVRYHHERYDGRGYPEGLKGEEIPMIACIISVADAFDAMTTDRPYRKGFTNEEGIEEIKRNIALQFHPKPAQALIELFEMGKI